MTQLKKLFLAAFVALVAISAAGSAQAAFSNSYLVRASTSPGTTPRVWTYASTGEALSTILAANYFAATPQRLTAGDMLYVRGSDGEALVTVTSASTSASVVEELGGTWACADGTGYGTAGAVAYIAAPITGKIVKLQHVLTTVVDADVVLNVDVGGTNATGSATIASSGVAVGDVDSATVSASNSVTAGALIKVESDGGGTAGAGTSCVKIVP